MALIPFINHAQALIVESPAFYGAALLATLIGIFRYIVLRQSRRLNFPVVGKAVDSEIKNDLIEGAKLVYDTTSSD
jgi:hypothetical protein